MIGLNRADGIKMDRHIDLLATAIEYEKRYRRSSYFDSIYDTGYCPFNPLRLQEILNSLINAKRIGNGDKFLDLGSGIGLNVVIAASLGLNAYGIEINPRLAKSSQELVEILKEKGLFPEGVECKTIYGSYFPNDYIRLREDKKSAAVEFEEDCGTLKDYFFPFGNPEDIYKIMNLDLRDVKVFYRYGWKGDVPSLWELFSLYGNKDAILINPSGGFPVSKIPRMLERFVLETCISDPERIYVLQKKSPKNQ